MIGLRKGVQSVSELKIMRKIQDNQTKREIKFNTPIISGQEVKSTRTSEKTNTLVIFLIILCIFLDVVYILEKKKKKLHQI